MTKDYGDLSLSQLRTEQQKVGKQYAALKQEAVAIQVVLDAKQGEAEAEAKVAAMSDPEKAALAQAIKASGVESGEAVGTPGG